MPVNIGVLVNIVEMAIEYYQGTALISLWSYLSLEFLFRYHYDTGMKSILVRNLPEQTLSRLKRLADYHHRSLQGELHYLLEEASRLAPESGSEKLRIHTVNTGNQGFWSREEVYGDEAR